MFMYVSDSVDSLIILKQCANASSARYGRLNNVFFLSVRFASILELIWCVCFSLSSDIVFKMTIGVYGTD